MVLEAGLGDASGVWSQVQEPLGHDTRVCSYDRWGNGNSGAGPTHQRNPLEAVSDLHDLLRNAGICPPYVLVGHSYGGLLARLFAQTCFSRSVPMGPWPAKAHEKRSY